MTIPWLTQRSGGLRFVAAWFYSHLVPPELVLRGKSSKGKELVRQFGATWEIVGEAGHNVVIVSPPTQPTYTRAVMRVGDSNFHVREVGSSGD